MRALLCMITTWIHVYFRFEIVNMSRMKCMAVDLDCGCPRKSIQATWSSCREQLCSCYSCTSKNFVGHYPEFVMTRQSCNRQPENLLWPRLKRYHGLDLNSMDFNTRIQYYMSSARVYFTFLKLWTRLESEKGFTKTNSEKSSCSTTIVDLGPQKKKRTTFETVQAYLCLVW